MTGKPGLEAGGPATPADLDASKATLAASAAELDLVRAAASKWQVGLAGLLGVVTGSSVLGIGEKIAGLTSGLAVVAAVLLALSVLLAVTSVYWALKASGGTPKPYLTGTASGYSAHSQAKEAAEHLGHAISAAMMSLLLFGVVAAMTWFGPTASEAEPRLLIERVGEQFCSTDVLAIGSTVFVESGDEVAKITVDEITAIRAVDACPGG